jgi:succinate dehydrogenase / fumarate reductase cytochrome b subunit
MSWFVQTLTSSLGKKYIMALTGSLLGGFLLVHAAGNASIFWGRDAFISYAEHLHALGFLLEAAEIVLSVLFLAHVITGVLLFFSNYRARDSRYAVSGNGGGRTWGSKTMPYTGLIILCFLGIHLWNFHFDDTGRTIADIVAEVLNRPFYTVIYSIGLLALALHISHGFWSMFQSVGINHPRYDFFIRCSAWIFCTLIAGVFLLIVFLLLVNSTLLV